MKKLLLTGFVPFLHFPINPSEQIVSALDGEQIGEYIVIGRVLPVEFAKSGPQILQFYHELQPDAVISLGLAGGRKSITPERIAINCIDGEADNTGVRYEDQSIIENGPPAYFSTLPIRKIMNRLIENGLSAEISNTAGLYLCNNVMYNILHTIYTEDRQIPAGFIHIPASNELAKLMEKEIPSWPLQDLTTAIRLAIEAL